jgi:catechol 2,3-dioxygenase-like lactoylglutathione lyase family enzyme/ribosomal protein S18 acetylase RimI-like enzyme
MATHTQGLLWTVHDGAPPDEARIVDQGLDSFNHAAAPVGDSTPLCCFARTLAGLVVGGAVGRTWGACCELLQLWVDPECRRRGIGSELVRRFEAQARARGCRSFYLETFSFQAPQLYRNLGYRVALAIDGYAPGIVKYIMVHRLESASADDGDPARLTPTRIIASASTAQSIDLASTRTPAMQIDRFDHIVLTVRDIAVTRDFYVRVLGMTAVEFAGGRTTLAFGRQKINLHPAGREYEPKADRPTPGSADLCLISATPLDDVIAQLARHGVRIIEGPVRRTGALGPIRSVYFRDPDANLIEVSVYEADAARSPGATS